MAISSAPSSPMARACARLPPSRPPAMRIRPRRRSRRSSTPASTAPLLPAPPIRIGYPAICSRLTWKKASSGDSHPSLRMCMTKTPRFRMSMARGSHSIRFDLTGHRTGIFPDECWREPHRPPHDALASAAGWRPSVSGKLLAWRNEDRRLFKDQVGTVWGEPLYIYVVGVDWYGTSSGRARPPGRHEDPAGRRTGRSSCSVLPIPTFLRRARTSYIVNSDGARLVGPSHSRPVCHPSRGVQLTCAVARRQDDRLRTVCVGRSRR